MGKPHRTVSRPRSQRSGAQLALWTAAIATDRGLYLSLGLNFWTSAIIASATRMDRTLTRNSIILYPHAYIVMRLPNDSSLEHSIGEMPNHNRIRAVLVDPPPHVDGLSEIGGESEKRGKYSVEVLEKEALVGIRGVVQPDCPGPQRLARLSSPGDPARTVHDRELAGIRSARAARPWSRSDRRD